MIGVVRRIARLGRALLASPQDGWRTTLPSKTPGDFTMAALLIFVDDINPLR